tara:strand:- start:1152 stop:1496 length:345 start_codon:yes stop_codon:yes gene_type:complete
MNKISNKSFKPEDFIIHVRPSLTPDGGIWNGQIEVNIITAKNNGLTKTDSEAMFHLCKCMAGVVPMMEENKDLMYEVEEFIEKYTETKKDYLTVKNKAGNVIELDWKSKTKGSV